MADKLNLEITLTAASLDEFEGSMVLRGVIAPGSFDHLQVAPYQREILPDSKLKDLAQAMINNERLPDIELGMRGQDFEQTDTTTVVLKNPTFIIDGLQRVSAGRRVIDNRLAVPHLGCVVHIDTTEVWERDRFRKLNMNRTKLSTSIVLRNMQGESPAVDALYHFSEVERTSPMYGRVCWQQRMCGPQFITALQLLKTAGFINARFGPGRSVSAEDLAKSLDKTIATMGDKAFIGNLRKFYSLIDECFTIRKRTIRSGATCLRTTFVRALAYLLVEHQDFWQGNELTVPRALLKKIGAFNINDPEVSRLAGSSGQAWHVLAQMLIEHVNSGKRAENRLKRFPQTASVDDEEAEVDEDDAPAAAVG